MSMLVSGWVHRLWADKSNTCAFFLKFMALDTSKTTCSKTSSAETWSLGHAVHNDWVMASVQRVSPCLMAGQSPLRAPSVPQAKAVSFERCRLKGYSDLLLTCRPRAAFFDFLMSGRERPMFELLAFSRGYSWQADSAALLFLLSRSEKSRS